MKAVAAMRNQFGGHAVHTPPPPGGDQKATATRCTSRTCRRDFRSYADVDVHLEPGVTAFIGRNGQGKTNLVEAIDYLSRLASHRVASDAPLVRAGTEQALIRVAVVRDGRTATMEIESTPAGQPGADQPVPALPRARADRPGPHGRLLPRGPDPGQGRPVGPPSVPRRPARAARTAAGRRPRRLRSRAAATQLPAEDGRSGTPRVVLAGGRPSRRSVCGTPRPHGWRGSSPSGSRWSSRCALRRQGLRDRGPWRQPRTPRSSTARRSTSEVSRQAPGAFLNHRWDGPSATEGRRLRRLRSNRLTPRPGGATGTPRGGRTAALRRARPRGSPSSARTATTSCSPSATPTAGSRSRATPPTARAGRSRSR